MTARCESRISWVTLGCWLLWVGVASATAATAEPLPFEATGSFHAISVADLDSMIAWYQTSLGFELVSRGGNEQRQGALLRRPGILLELAEFPTARSREGWNLEAESHEVHGVFKLGLLVDDLDAAFAYAQEKQFDVFFGIVKADDGRTFGIRDPEGNIVQFFEP